MQAFDVWQLAQDPGHGEVQYQGLVGRSRSAPKPPAFMAGTLPGGLGHTWFGQFDISPVGVFCIEGGAVARHATVFHRGAGVYSPYWNVSYLGFEYVLTQFKRTDFSNPTRYLKGNIVALAGPSVGVWGHWLVDFLPRLWVLHLAGYNIYGLRYLLPKATPRFAVLLLGLLGIPESALEWYDDQEELIACENLILPTYMRSMDRFSPALRDGVKFMMETIRARPDMPSPPVAAQRLFLSRRKTMAQRVVENREEIEALAARRGFTVIDPTDYSVAEQISLFGAARQIMGEYGSALHNSMFSRPGVTVCALRGSSNHPNFIQSGIAEALGQEVGYVFADTPFEAINQRFAIPPGDVNRALDWLDVRMAAA